MKNPLTPIVGKIFTLLILSTLTIYGQEASPRFKFDVDYARFQASRGYIFLEIYISVPREILKYEPGVNGYIATYEFAIDIFHGDSLLKTLDWKKNDALVSLDQIKKGQQIYEIYQTYLSRGEFKFRIKLKDLTTQKEGWNDIDVAIRPFTQQNLSISDLQLSLGIRRDQRKNPYVKNGFQILPNPTAFFGAQLSTLYYYCEIYNLSPLDSLSEPTYSVQALIKDTGGNVIRELPVKKKKRLAASLVEMDSISVENLSSGAYILQLVVHDDGRDLTVSNEKRFYVYQPNLAASTTAADENLALHNEFIEMDEKELNKYFEMIKYIVSGDEKKIFKELDLRGKREFMAKFWKNRDNDPATEVNEFKQEFFLRIASANARFSVGEKEGWQTDRGRILIVYGEPDNIERVLDSEYQYQIWYYDNLEGGIEFVFADMFGYGELRLVHSTSRNEVQDYQWQTRFRR